MIDPAFEPFSEDAIEARKYAPDVLMQMARIAFASNDLTDDERAAAQRALREKLAYLVSLAEIGLAAPRSSQRVN